MSFNEGETGMDALPYQLQGLDLRPFSPQPRSPDYSNQIPQELGRFQPQPPRSLLPQEFYLPSTPSQDDMPPLIQQHLLQQQLLQQQHLLQQQPQQLLQQQQQLLQQQQQQQLLQQQQQIQQLQQQLQHLNSQQQSPHGFRPNQPPFQEFFSSSQQNNPTPFLQDIRFIQQQQIQQQPPRIRSLQQSQPPEFGYYPHQQQAYPVQAEGCSIQRHLQRLEQVQHLPQPPPSQQLRQVPTSEQGILRLFTDPSPPPEKSSRPKNLLAVSDSALFASETQGAAKKQLVVHEIEGELQKEVSKGDKAVIELTLPEWLKGFTTVRFVQTQGKKANKETEDEDKYEDEEDEYEDEYEDEGDEEDEEESAKEPHLLCKATLHRQSDNGLVTSWKKPEKKKQKFPAKPVVLHTKELTIPHDRKLEIELVLRVTRKSAVGVGDYLRVKLEFSNSKNEVVLIGWVDIYTSKEKRLSVWKKGYAAYINSLLLPPLQAKAFFALTWDLFFRTRLPLEKITTLGWTEIEKYFTGGESVNVLRDWLSLYFGNDAHLYPAKVHSLMECSAFWGSARSERDETLLPINDKIGQFFIRYSSTSGYLTLVCRPPGHQSGLSRWHLKDTKVGLIVIGPSQTFELRHSIEELCNFIQREAGWIPKAPSDCHQVYCYLRDLVAKESIASSVPNARYSNTELGAYLQNQLNT